MDINVLINQIKKLAEETEIKVQEVQKGKATLTGISISNGNVCPVVYAEYYEDDVITHGYNYVAQEIYTTLKRAVEKAPTEYNSDTISIWDLAKDRLRICVGPKGTNKDCVTYDWLDLELYLRVEIDRVYPHIVSYKVTEPMLEKWKVTTEEIFNQAKECMKSLYMVKNLNEILYDMTQDPLFLCMDTEIKIITTETCYHGASVIFDTNILKAIADQVEDDLIIFPSSVHEMLVHPRYNMDINQATEVVKAVNHDCVALEETLSDHAYIFHRDTLSITW